MNSVSARIDGLRRKIAAAQNGGYYLDSGEATALCQELDSLASAVKEQEQQHKQLQLNYEERGLYMTRARDEARAATAKLESLQASTKLKGVGRLGLGPSPTERLENASSFPIGTLWLQPFQPGDGR